MRPRDRPGIAGLRLRGPVELAESLLISLAIGLAVVYSATPLVILLADRWQFYDRPIGYKGHTRPTPYLGGAAVMAGFAFAVLLAAGDWERTAPLVGGVAVLWLVGTIDDRRDVSPGIRVAVEVGLGVMVWAAGIGWHLHAGSGTDLAVTCVWTVAVVNAFNLFDNMDGAATTIAVVVSAAVAALGVIRHDEWLAVASAALGGACLGFLPRNLSRPARIFLGDGGSMPLGFAVALLVMVAAASPTPGQSMVVGLLLVGIPAVDTCLVVVSRSRRGISVLTGGQDHLTHRVRRFMPGPRAVAVSLGAVQAGTCGLAVLAAEGGPAAAAASALIYLVLAAGAIGVLERRPATESAATGATAATGRPAPSAGQWAILAGLAVIGLGAGLSPFLSDYYDAAAWVPIGLGVIVAASLVLMAGPQRLGGPAAVAVGGVLGLGIWSLGSAAWAQSVENAVVDGNRLLVYGALLVLVVTLLGGERRSAWLLVALRVGVLAVAGSVLARLLGGDPASLFLNGRLNAPLGYINGEGCLFVMGFWLCWAAAEGGRPVAAGAGAGGATLMACLALLSQSRGTALAMAVSLLAVMAVAPGRRTRALGLLLVGVGVALAQGPLLALYRNSGAAIVSTAGAHAAGRAAAAAAVGVGVAWAGAVAARRRLETGDAALAARVGRAASGMLAVVGLACVLALGILAPRIESTARTQWHVFTHLGDPAGSTVGSTPSQSRLLSGAGNRYDYWLIAWHVWQANPIIGIGAGNYDRPYFEQRATLEDIRQPHSIELQTLSELGIVGGLLLIAFVAGIAAGVRRMRRAAGADPAVGALLVAALGTAAAWFTQTSVDWIHLLPGVTAIALGAIAVLVSGSGRSDGLIPGAGAGPPAHGGGVRRVAAAAGVAGLAVALVTAGGSLTRQGLADWYRAKAQAAVTSDPPAAVRAADRSLSFDPDAVASYYAKAAAQARLDQAAAVEATLQAALAREPNNFVTWTLLADIAVRQGRLRAASHDYSRAHALNPRDPTLVALAANPGAGLR